MVEVENLSTHEMWSFKNLTNAISFCFCITNNENIQTIADLNRIILPLGYVAREM